MSTSTLTQVDLTTFSNPTTPVPIAVAHGDGIGPEIMDAVLRVLDAAGAAIQAEPVKIGQEVYLSGHTSGIAPESWDTLRRTQVFLKAPITTPQGSGYKSLNVTIRKSLGLFANVRPCQALVPYVPSHFPDMDLVIVRENEEDLYAGIEHRQTPEVIQCLKLVSRPGCERVIRYAFEYARANGRKKVTCMSKDNIMKLTDGLFHEVFREVATEYPEIESEHYIVDIGAAMLADRPERFDVVVTLNLYGDILSDITAQVAGSVGMGGSSNIGENFAMFEAIHGSAPDIAGKNIANPSGLLQAACLMLTHIGQGPVAERIQNALLKTLEDGLHTADIANESFTLQKLGTQEFADAIIARLGQEPQVLKPVRLGESKPIQVRVKPTAPVKKELLGIDLFLDWAAADRNPQVLGEQLAQAAKSVGWKLKMITNRGVKVYPDGMPETFCTDHWRCRFMHAPVEFLENNRDVVAPQITDYQAAIQLLQAVFTAGFDIIKTENLYQFDGERGYSLGQGE